MICEYCNMYTPGSLKRVRGILPEIKEKFMLENVEYTCDSCFSRFKSAEQWFVKFQIIYNNQNKIHSPKDIRPQTRQE